jgi:hypothetical protein
MALATLALTASLTGTPAPCAEGLIHYMPYCLTQEEYAALIKPPPPAYPYVEGVEQWRPMVDYYWGKHGATTAMLKIMECESRGRWWVYNEQGSGAAGLFQIMPMWKKVWGGDYLDPWINAATAYQIWLVQGYGAWACA